MFSEKQESKVLLMTGSFPWNPAQKRTDSDDTNYHEEHNSQSVSYTEGVRLRRLKHKGQDSQQHGQSEQWFHCYSGRGTCKEWTIINEDFKQIVTQKVDSFQKLSR